MAILFADVPSGQANLFGTGARMLEGVYSLQKVIIEADPDPLYPNGVVYRCYDDISNLDDGGFVYPLQKAAQPTVGIAARIWIHDFGGGIQFQKFHTFTESANVDNHLFYMVCDASGRLGIVHDGGTTYTDAPVVTPAGWYHIEMKMTQGGIGLCSAGIRVNGAEKLALTNLTAISSRITNVALAGCRGDSSIVGENTPYKVKDLVIWDGTGTKDNDWLGSVSVWDMLEDSDVAMPWTITGGATGAAILARRNAPTDAAFISAADPPPAAAVVGLANVPPDTTTVRALVVLTRARKTDGGDGNLQVGITVNAATALGVDRPITTAFTYYQDVFDLNPDGNVPWTPATANLAQLQLNRTL